MNVGAILIHRTQMNAGPPRRTHRAAFHGSTGCARGTKGYRCVRNVGSRTRKRLVEWHIIFKIIESFHILHFLWFRQTMDCPTCAMDVWCCGILRRTRLVTWCIDSCMAARVARSLSRAIVRDSRTHFCQSRRNKHTGTTNT